MSTDFIKRRTQLSGKDKGPKVKPRGGKAKLAESKNKAHFAKAKEKKGDSRINLSDLINELNARKGVELSTKMGKGALTGLAGAITKKLKP